MDNETQDLEKSFENRVWNSISVMKEDYGYDPKVLISMMHEYGAVEAVRRLINSSKPPEGFMRLLELNALRLSLEAIILEEKWKDLFSEEDRKKAKKRLTDNNFFGKS